MCGYHGEQDEEEWNEEWNDSGELEAEFDSEGCQPGEAPLEVKAVERLRYDLEALLWLMSAEEPPTRKVRSLVLRNVFYGFGDASAIGFGDALWKQPSAADWEAARRGDPGEKGHVASASRKVIFLFLSSILDFSHF